MRGYKFVPSAVLGAVLSKGSVRIGTAAEFRAADGFDDGRSDPHELTSHFEPGPTSVCLRDHPDLLRSIAKGNPIPPGAENLTLEFAAGAALKFVSDGYLFCFSKKIIRLCIDNMAEKFSCDACYSISDIALFGKAIMNRSPSLQKSEDALHPFGKGHGDWVKYDRVDEGLTSFRGIDPFRKPKRFRWQNEGRLFWQGVEPYSPFIIEVPEIIPLIREIRL